MFSLNFLNRKNQNVTEDASEDWFTPPELFTRLVSPKPDNGFRSEAVYLVKGGAPEGVGWRERRRRRREAGSTGGVWVRKVRLIPPDQVLGDSYNKAAADRALAVNVARFEEIRAAVGGGESARVDSGVLPSPGDGRASGGSQGRKRGGRAHGGGQSSPGGAPESGAPTGGVASASPVGGLPGTRPAGGSAGSAPVSVLPGVPVGGLPGTVPAGGSAGSAPAGSSPTGGSGGPVGGAPVRRGLRR